MSDDRTRADPAEELDAIAAALSHDLRAPLRAIDGFSRILLSDSGAGLPEDTRRYLALVRDAGTEVADLLDDLVEIVRVGRVELAARDGVDPAQLARELIEAVMAPRAGSRSVAWEVGDVPACRADPALLRRLLEELLDNALKFTAGNSAARISFGWDADAGAYVVADDGIGVDGDLPAQAYEIFGRLHGRAEFAGTGAGLAIARRIAARHGGRVWCSGTPGGGARAWFTVAD
ncbi:MAG TPA: ATP-binding protein [Baekduia sp.]|nr:ATP-binding protein [Baekduia sp.]